MVAVMNNVLELERSKPMTVVQDEYELVRFLLGSARDLATTFGLTSEELAKCLVSRGELPLEIRLKENAAALREIQEHWETQFEPEGLKLWLRQPVPLFVGETPLQKLLAGKHQSVLRALLLSEGGIHV